MAWWNLPTTQNYNPSGNEYGIDIATPYHTPITNLLSGTVFQADYQSYGGEVGVKTTLNGQSVNEYFQHLDDIAVQVGQSVGVGSLIGLSGGQTTGGDHPATTGSTGPHTEFGFGAPWIGGGPNFDPSSFLKGYSMQQSNPVDSIGQTISGVVNTVTGNAPVSTTNNAVHTVFGDIPLPSTDFWIRSGLVVGGAIILIIGIYGLVERPSVVVNEEK